MKARKKLNEPYIYALHITWSGTIQGDGVVTMTPQMMVDKALEPFYKAMAEHNIRDMKFTVDVNVLEEAKELVNKSRKGY